MSGQSRSCAFYPVFLVEFCSFMIKFNSSFVLSQEKSSERTNDSDRYEK